MASFCNVSTAKNATIFPVKCESSHSSLTHKNYECPVCSESQRNGLATSVKFPQITHLFCFIFCSVASNWEYLILAWLQAGDILYHLRKHPSNKCKASSLLLI